MRHRTRTIATITATVLLFGVGAVLGLGMARKSTDAPSAASVQAPVNPEASPELAGPGMAPAGADPAPGGGNAAPAANGDGAGEAGAAGADVVAPNPGGDDAGDLAVDDAGQDAPDEDPPARRRPPEIPDLELRPGALDPPDFGLPGVNDNADDEDGPAPADDAPPAPVAIPMSVTVTALGPGPIWERGGARACPNIVNLEATWVGIAVHQSPSEGPYQVSGTARAGATVRQVSVSPEPGPSGRFKVGYSFPRGSVQEPTSIAVSITVTDAHGHRANLGVGGRPVLGHRLYPADSCP